MGGVSAEGGRIVKTVLTCYNRPSHFAQFVRDGKFPYFSIVSCLASVFYSISTLNRPLFHQCRLSDLSTTSRWLSDEIFSVKSLSRNLFENKE